MSEENQYDEIKEAGAEEEAMLEAAERAYVKKGNPKPLRVKVNLWHIVLQFGPDMVFQLIALIGAAYISATRIGILMEIAQANLISQFNQSGNTIDLGGDTGTFRIMAMMAFEGALIAAGLYDGQKLTEKTQSPWAERTAFLVTAIGGFMSTITLQRGSAVDEIAYWTGWVFSIVAAVASSIVVRFTAKNIGFLWAAVLRLQEEFDKKWLDTLKVWRQGLDGFYTQFAAHRFGVDRRKRVKFDNGNGDGVPTPKPKVNGNGLGERISEYLRQAGIRPTEVGDGLRIQPAQIADALNMTADERTQIHTYLNRLRKKDELGQWQ